MVIGQQQPAAKKRRLSRSGRALASAAAALALLVAGGAHAATLAEDGAFNLTVAPAKFNEHCFRLAAGQTLIYTFEATAEVDFNLHYHRGREVFYPIKTPAMRRIDAARHTAVHADDYCLMWENRGNAPVVLRGSIARSSVAR